MPDPRDSECSHCEERQGLFSLALTDAAGTVLDRTQVCRECAQEVARRVGLYVPKVAFGDN
jgi:hypothetical protein